MDSPTPVNVSALLGCLGIVQPMIFVPTSDKHGHKYATWDKVCHTADDKDTAYHIAWLFSGLLSEETEVAPGDIADIMVDSSSMRVHIDDSQFAWMVAIRAATLFNAIHDEAHWSV